MMPPQLDLEKLRNDGKISCKTPDDDGPAADDVTPVDGDFPPESFWLSKDAEYDWFDQHAFFERKDSTRANSSFNLHIKPTNANHNSQRFSVNLKTKASIIGLPKTQKATFVDYGRRNCKSANIRLFPKRSMSAGVSRVPFAEPGSPKVSCIGRVRSKRGRRRSNSSKKSEKPMEKSKTGRNPAEKSKPGGVKVGFYSKVMGMFRSKKGPKKAPRSRSRKVAEVLEEEPAVVASLRGSVSFNAASEPPGLGGMMRFASGRRSASWASEDFCQVVLEPLDFDQRAGGSLLEESREVTRNCSSFK